MNVSEDVRKLNPGITFGYDAKIKFKARLPENDSGMRFRSKLERRAWNEWVPLQGAAVAWYEPFVLHLTGGNYTPDIVLIRQDGEMWIIEVKSKWEAYPSGRSSKRNLRQAAIEFAPLGRFFSLMPGRGSEWKLTEITK